MAFNDIRAWREMMDAEEQDKAAYDKACEDAVERAAKAAREEYDEIDQVQVDSSALEDRPSRAVGLEDLEDDDVDFSAYGISEADLGVGPADEHYPTARDLAREPLVRIPAAIGRPASDADLAAQDVVQLMAEALKKLKAEQEVDEDQEFEESESLDEEDGGSPEDGPAGVDDKIEKMSDDGDYPLSDDDWDEIEEEPSYQKKIEKIESKVKDRWASLSPEAKRRVRQDVEDLRAELLKSRWAERQYEKALRLQKISRKRALTPDEEKQFAEIVQFGLDDEQRGRLENNLYSNGYRIPREGRTAVVPASDAQSGNVRDFHSEGGDAAEEKRNEDGLDTQFDVSKYEYVPEPMNPGETVPADFDVGRGPDDVQPKLNAQREIDAVAKNLEPGHAERKKAWRRKEAADSLGDDFYTDSPKAWKKLVGLLEPDEIAEIAGELADELPGNKADNKRMLDYMFGDMKLTQVAMGAQAGYGADQKGYTGGLTQQGDKLMGLLLYALAKHLNICQDPIDLTVRNDNGGVKTTHYDSMADALWANLRSENTVNRESRKELRRRMFPEVCAELGVDLAAVARSAGAAPAYGAGVKAKRAADNVLMTLFVREYDHMQPAEREDLRRIFRAYEDGAKIVKLYTGLDDDQNSEFQDLLARMRDEGDLPNEDRVRLMFLDTVRLNPGVGEAQARAEADRRYAEMTRGGDDREFVRYTTDLAKKFLRGHSTNVTRDTITNPERAR